MYFCHQCFCNVEDISYMSLPKNLMFFSNFSCEVVGVIGDQ
jgi:hypothetical protein